MAKGFIIASFGVVLSFALGLGAGAQLASLGAFGSVRRLACATPPPSARQRFLQCAVSEPIPTSEELEGMLAQRQGRDATPAWGVP